jgi:hypothetical protein
MQIQPSNSTFFFFFVGVFVFFVIVSFLLITRSPHQFPPPTETKLMYSYIIVSLCFCGENWAKAPNPFDLA